MRQRRLGDAFDAEPAAGVGAERNVGEGELIAFDELSCRQLGVGDPPYHAFRVGILLDGGHVAFFRRGSDQRPEHRPVHGLQRGERPVQPAVDGGTRFRGAWIDRRILSVGQREIPHDGIGFPQHKIAVHQSRHAPVGIHGEIIRLGIAAECHAGVDAPVAEAQLLGTPKHLLDIDRIGAAPNRQMFLIAVRHGFPWAVWIAASS